MSGATKPAEERCYVELREAKRKIKNLEAQLSAARDYIAKLEKLGDNLVKLGQCVEYSCPSYIEELKGELDMASEEWWRVRVSIA